MYQPSKTCQPNSVSPFAFFCASLFSDALSRPGPFLVPCLPLTMPTFPFAVSHAHLHRVRVIESAKNADPGAVCSPCGIFLSSTSSSVQCLLGVPYTTSWEPPFFPPSACGRSPLPVRHTPRRGSACPLWRKQSRSGVVSLHVSQNLWLWVSLSIRGALA